MSITDHPSRIQLLDCSKLAINPKNDNVTICQNDILINFFLGRHESAIKEKTQKSSHSELHKREALPNAAGGLRKISHIFLKICPRLANFESIFTANIMNNNSV